MKVADLIADFEASLAAIRSYGYKLVTWQEFQEATDRPDGLLNRAILTSQIAERIDVIYDPDDDGDGWLLVGNRNEIVRETAAHLIGIDPPDGPLSRTELPL